MHPSIAESGFAALGAAMSAPVGVPDLPDPAVVCPDLLQWFAAVSDGRSDQGRVHPVAVVLALCAVPGRLAARPGRPVAATCRGGRDLRVPPAANLVDAAPANTGQAARRKSWLKAL